MGIRPYSGGLEMPLADFACLSKKCARKDGTAPVFEATTKAIACPACGSRKIKRLYNKIQVRIGRARPEDDSRHTSSRMSHKVDALAEPAMLDAERRKRKGLEAGQRWKFDNGTVRAVPVSRIGGELQRVYAEGGQQALAPGGLPLTKATVGGSTHETIEEHLNRPVPRIIAARDTEHQIVKRGGKLSVEKA